MSPESQMGFEPTTLRDLVGCSNHLSYWRLYGEQGPICGSPPEPHHAATQPSNDWHTRSEELTNSIALSPTIDNNKSSSLKGKILLQLPKTKWEGTSQRLFSLTKSRCMFSLHTLLAHKLTCSYTNYTVH